MKRSEKQNKNQTEEEIKEKKEKSEIRAENPEKIKKRSRTIRIVSNVLVFFLFFMGFALVLYPTVADKINESQNKDVIAEYRRKLMTLDNSEYEAMIRAATEYNDMLFKSRPFIGALTEEERRQYESLLNIDESGIMGYIEIPKSNIYLAIYHGTEESVLQTGVGHLEASSLPIPGESVHTVLSGHSGLPSARLFTDLDKLEVGDTFTLHIMRETLTYRVEKTARVSPDELNEMQIEEGKELCTLMTCTPYGINTHRLVVVGSRIDTPTESVGESASAVKFVTSKWNRMFLFLPCSVFVLILICYIVIRKKIKKKNRLAASDNNRYFKSL